VRRWSAESTAGCREPWASDGQALAALAATARQDRAPGTGPHAEAEAVHLVTAAVVRLVRTLAHGYFSEGFEGCPLRGRIRCWPRFRPQRSGTSAGTAHPRSRQAADHGHAAPVDRERPANGTRRGKWGSNPRDPLRGQPVDDVLLRTRPGCYVPCLRGRVRPRSFHGPRPTVSWLTRRTNRPLTCGNAGRITHRRSSGGSTTVVGAISAQLVDNSVEAQPVSVAHHTPDGPGRASISIPVIDHRHDWHDDMVEAKAVRWTTSR
jgi:hypothetical protein